ncbi:MAG TPA: sigma-70 family RNA polymerase sigma factor [Bacillota bacterium]|jgi:RNA polymerase sigma-I factor|nr:sigma-70 family RNA polymerase sigma factor [Clostridia bacterium]NMA35716.1 sigma-70 family RNA polymerase sigma factor [Clostridiaceae bacterium]HPY63869.1 sigma-70 family RNA polymerase sigma factor [Bacillota bacterium]MBP6161506.1 sigma-70 family RNA polymerase sigma factor [Clostridia bacterium]MBP6949706.1 sigma-70 family RNA polymerase sigma factor [Clostridia bacterium]
MHREQDMAERVYAARRDPDLTDDFIYQYLPFIKAETTRFLKRACDDQDDELSIAMIAFHDAMNNYHRDRGAFIPYASLVIRNRLTDYVRKEERHRRVISLEAPLDENLTLGDTIAVENHDPLQNEELQTTIDEIMEFKEQLRSFDITLEELVEQTPKQQRSLDTCKKALAYTIENRTLLQGIVETGRLPLKEIADGAQVSRKTLERHRKYLVGIFLIFSNGYAYMRDHLNDMLLR